MIYGLNGSVTISEESLKSASEYGITLRQLYEIEVCRLTGFRNTSKILCYAFKHDTKMKNYHYLWTADGLPNRRALMNFSE